MNNLKGKSKYQLRKPTSEATYNQSLTALRALAPLGLKACLPAPLFSSFKSLALHVLAYRLRGSHSIIRELSTSDLSKHHDGGLMGSQNPLAQCTRYSLKLPTRCTLPAPWWVVSNPLGKAVFPRALAGCGRPLAALSCTSLGHSATPIAGGPCAIAHPLQFIALLILRPCWPVCSSFLTDLICHLIGGLPRPGRIGAQSVKGIKLPAPYRLSLVAPHRLPLTGRVGVDGQPAFVACLNPHSSGRRRKMVFRAGKFD